METEDTTIIHDTVSEVRVDSDDVQAAVDAASSIAIPGVPDPVPAPVPPAPQDVNTVQGGEDEDIMPVYVADDDGTGIGVTTMTTEDGVGGGVDIGIHDEVTEAMHEAMPSLTIPTTTDTTTTAATSAKMQMEEAPLPTPSKLSSKQERMDAIWLKHFKELQEYKAQNNHVRVPRKSGPLGEWVRTQRRYYKLWRRGENVPLTKERMEMLDQLGFVWLPAEEKVGGGFRGGRPKKRKREEEAAAAAAVAAAVVAGTEGAAAGIVGPNGQVFYNHMTTTEVGEDGTVLHVPMMTLATEGNIEDGDGGEDGTLAAAANHTGVVMDVGSGDATADGTTTTTTLAASVAAAHQLPMTTIPYNFHQDPFYLHSLAKRTDIGNQLALLEKHESINRLQLIYNGQGAVKEESFPTQRLTDAHSHYEDVVYVMKRANEELRDAELALDRAKKTYASAQELKDKADALLENASEEVLKAELDDGDDEWIGMYKCLVKYQEQHGNILFPRVSNYSTKDEAKEGDSSGDQDAADVNGNADENVDVDADEDENVDADADVSKGGNEEVSYGTVNTVVTINEAKNADKSKDEDDDDGSPNEVMDIDKTPPTENDVTEGTEPEVEEVADAATDVKEVETEGMDIECPVDDNAPPAATEAPTTKVYATTSTINVTEAVLHDWVGKMRKFPKKQLKKWRRYALDKLGFVWHQYNATWTDRYRELVEFREKHGHTVVPTSNSNLGIWVGTQRKQYRLMQQGKPSHMTPERVEMLNQIDFVWLVNTWNERYEELKAFKEQFGHFLVPTDYENRQLRPWITTQRSHFRFLQEGKPSQLTQERIDLLDKIGFPWKTREDWLTRFQELKQYIEENGNCAVPRNYTKYPKLYRWVNCQRMEYQKHTEGSVSRLKADQISMLEDVGFE